MMTIRAALLGTALLAAAPALAQPAPPPGGPGAGPRGERGPGAMFGLVDTNKDGKVTWEEGWAFVQQRFAAADPDKDGRLNQQEMEAARLRPGPGRPERAEGPQHARMVGMMFRGLDANRDGVVTLEEGAIMGGAGSAVLEALQAAGLSVPVLQLGLPDVFIEHGEPAKLLALQGLDAAGILQSIKTRFPAPV